MCLLPGTPAERALAIADRLRLEFMRAGREVAGRNRNVRATLSIGLATVTDGLADLQDVLARADAALPAPKHVGRDRCVVASDLPSSAASPRAAS